MLPLTNFQAYQRVKKHYKEHKDEIKRGILADRERMVIAHAFSLASKDLIQIQDARDFVVAICDADIHNIITGQFDKFVDERELLKDMMSAITYAIDCVKLSRGGNV